MKRSVAATLLSVFFLSCTAPLQGEHSALTADDLIVRQVDEISVNTILENPGGSDCSDPPTAINIAPATSGNISTPGTSETIEGTDVFQAILNKAGINACNSDPTDFCDENPGLIGTPITGEGDDVSEVLNPGGKRATFGFYITYFKCDQAYEYFALFSYDKVGENCAFEFFLFGPITRGDNGEPTSSPLLQGLAINKDGIMLDEVPTNIAAEDNFFNGGIQDGVPPTPVTPGIGTAGQNCRSCHTKGNTTPDRTRPFPWSTATINGVPVTPYDDDDDDDEPATQPATQPAAPVIPPVTPLTLTHTTAQ